jgi:dephospho-CoA kinase
MISSRKIPDDEKRRRADFVIDTGHGIELARQQVTEVIAAIRAGKGREADA